MLRLNIKKVNVQVVNEVGEEEEVIIQSSVEKMYGIPTCYSS